MDENYTRRGGIKSKKQKILVLSLEQQNPTFPEIIMITYQLTSLLESISPFKLSCYND